MAEAFTWGSGGQAETTSSRARRRLAEALISEGTSTAPVQSWTQGLARVAQALVGSYQMREEDQLERKQAEEAQAVLASHPAFAGASSPGVAKVTAALTGGQPVAAPGDPSLPRGIRNNNPLNIEAGTFTSSQPGYVGSDGRFARFETPEAGVAAANTLLDHTRESTA